MKTHSTLILMAALEVASHSAGAATLQGGPVHFAVSQNDSSIFYPTRALRKGDRFEVNVHHLYEYNRLMVVPCHPNCTKPDFVFAYPLRFGVQHLVIPITGHYYFWLERDQIGGPGIPYRFGWTRLPLPVLEQQVTEDHFLAKFDHGTDLSLRTLYVHPMDETEFVPDNADAKARILNSPVTY